MEIFIRKELKYLITQVQKDALLERMGEFMVPNEYYESNIHSIYFDTDSFDLMRICQNKPEFRQKIRVRSYAPVTDENDLLYLENKKKTRGIGHKTRSPICAKDMEAFLQHPQGFDQASKETALVFQRWNLKAQFTLYAHRFSYDWKGREDLRLTFDDVLTYRVDHPGLFRHSHDQSLLEDGQIILEIKCARNLPLELVRTLFELSIQPASYSKAGAVYQKCLERKNTVYEHTSDLNLSAAPACVRSRAVRSLDLLSGV